MRNGGSQLDFKFSGDLAILNCPAHLPFLQTLAACIRDGLIWNAGAPEPHDLPGLTLYLPSQAAVQPLKLEFLWASSNEASFLPRIRVLGEADPLDLFAAYAPRASAKTAIALLRKALAIPPAFMELERQLHLSAYAIEASAAFHSTRLEPGERLFSEIAAKSAAAIAREIGALIDEAHNDGADLSRIDELDSSSSSGGEQLSLQLLRSVRKRWLAQKLRTNKLDGLERRNRLMAVEAEFVKASKAPVIIAGSTASIAATMRLIEALVDRPNAALVLSGLDRDLDEEAWTILGEHPEHPQHGVQQLLARLGRSRDSVRDLQAARPLDEECERRRRAAFLSEALRPASTTARWASFATAERMTEGAPAPGLSLIEAETLQEEAAAIALILREALETREWTAALITPDETLMARVRHALTAWGLSNPPDGAGPDAFAVRAALTAASAGPDDLVALLRAAKGDEAPCFRRFAELIDLGVLRQMWRPSSMADVPAALARAEHAIAAGEARSPAMQRIGAAEWETVRAFAERVLDALSPLTARAAERLDLKEWMSAHGDMLARLDALGMHGVPEKDDEPSTLASAAKTAAPSLRLDIAGYASFFAECSARRPRPPKDNPHPRLFLLNPLDARLLAADVAVLGGLNEGVWPKVSGPSPWLSPRDRAFVGLSREERRIGLAARDFASLASVAPRVYLSRAKKVNGAVTRPSRWIARLSVLARGAGKLESLAPEHPWLSWARQRHTPATVTPAARPVPCPPLSARPRQLSVTAIETWFANPYAIYARRILGLDALRGASEAHDARDKGILYHAALHRFFQAYPGALPPNADRLLLRCLDQAADELGFNLENAPFWRPRFQRFASWFTASEQARRADLSALKSEIGGKLKLAAAAGAFVVTARADRIDIGKNGSVRIYDFKTSANAAKMSVARGAPQLTLEGLLAREGAFAGLPAGAEPELCYIVATGGEPPGAVVAVKGPCAEAIDAAAAGLAHRIARFDDPATPYSYEIRAIFRDKADNDPYAHLARVKEWSPAGEEEGDD